MVNDSSSAVTSDSVRIRQCCATFAWSPDPAMRPTTVWVLRTSIASSIGSPRREKFGCVGRYPGGVVAEVDRLVAGVDEHDSRLVFAGLGVLHRCIGDQDDEFTGMHQMCCRPVDSDDTAASFTGDGVGDQA